MPSPQQTQPPYGPDKTGDETAQVLFGRTARKLFLPVVLIFIVSIAIIAALVALIYQSTNQLALKQTQHLVSSIVKDQVRNVHDINFDNAYWDQAVENLVEAFDRTWADGNVGVYLYETRGITGTIVINERNEMTYGALEGEPVDDIAPYSPAILTLSTKARTALPLDGLPTTISGMIRDGENVYIAAATRLTGYHVENGVDVIDPTSSVLISLKSLDPQLLGELSENYLVPGLRFEMSGNALVKDGATLPLADAEGKPIGALHWTVEMPGDQLLKWMIPAFLLLFLAMSALTTLSARRANETALAVLTEMKARHDAEIQLKDAHREKLQALGSLVGGVAHNFNNYLQPILMLALSLQKTFAEGTKERADVDVIVKASKQAVHLVDQISLFSREKPDTIPRGDIYDAAKQALDLVATTLPSSIHLVTKLEDDAGTVPFEDVDIQTVMMNVITNAVKAMAGRTGTLTVALNRVALDAQDADAIAGIKPGDYAKLSIADTGVGMSPETLKRAFEPFFSTREVGSGMGLGLSTAYSIMTRHGGAITASSVPNTGSTFDIYFPLNGD